MPSAARARIPQALIIKAEANKNALLELMKMTDGEFKSYRSTPFDLWGVLGLTASEVQTLDIKDTVQTVSGIRKVFQEYVGRLLRERDGDGRCRRSLVRPRGGDGGARVGDQCRSLSLCLKIAEGARPWFCRDDALRVDVVDRQLRVRSQRGWRIVRKNLLEIFERRVRRCVRRAPHLSARTTTCAHDNARRLDAERPTASSGAVGLQSCARAGLACARARGLANQCNPRCRLAARKKGEERRRERRRACFFYFTPCVSIRLARGR